MSTTTSIRRLALSEGLVVRSGYLNYIRGSSLPFRRDLGLLWNLQCGGHATPSAKQLRNAVW
jgi:hypothetical protein